MGNNLITKQQMEEMTALYRSYKDNPAAHSFPKTTLPYSIIYTREAFDLLLQTPACEQVCIKFGMTEDDVYGLLIHPITVALDAMGNEILPGNSNTIQGGDPVIVDTGQRCPPDCPGNTANAHP